MTTILDQARSRLLDDPEIVAIAQSGGDLAKAIAARMPELLVSIHERNATLVLGSGYVVSAIRTEMGDGIAEHVWKYFYGAGFCPECETDYEADPPCDACDRCAVCACDCG